MSYKQCITIFRITFFDDLQEETYRIPNHGPGPQVMNEADKLQVL